MLGKLSFVLNTYLNFPVFLYQTPVLIPIGDIFLFAETAGLAWLLPTDPTIFHTLKEYERPLRRSDVVKTINYLDEDGRLIAKVPYKRYVVLSLFLLVVASFQVKL